MNGAAYFLRGLLLLLELMSLLGQLIAQLPLVLLLVTELHHKIVYFIQQFPLLLKEKKGNETGTFPASQPPTQTAACASTDCHQGCTNAFTPGGHNFEPGKRHRDECEGTGGGRGLLSDFGGFH